MLNRIEMQMLFSPPKFDTRPNGVEIVQLTYKRKAWDAFCDHIDKHNKLIEGAQEVYQFRNTKPVWHIQKDTFNIEPESKAYLIGIEPIKTESAEEILKDLVNEIDGYNLERFVKRAKKVLGWSKAND